MPLMQVLCNRVLMQSDTLMACEIIFETIK